MLTLLLACSGRPAAVPPTELPADLTPTDFASRAFALPDGTTVAVPGERLMVVEIIRSADW